MRFTYFKFFWSFYCMVATVPVLWSQDQAKECESKLDDAKMYYESGLLERVIAEDGISECLKSKHSMSREKKIESYRLLTETYLFKNDIDKADHHFKQVLHFNPLYSVDSTDPMASYDLIYLARTYRRKPVISLYGGAGANYTRVEVLQYYGTDNTNDPHAGYKDITVGANGILGIEVPVWRNFDFAMDVSFSLRTYKFTDSLYTNVTLTDARPDGVEYSAKPDKNLQYGSLMFRENQLWIDVPVMVRYNFGEKKIIPYLYVGANANFLLNSSLVVPRRTTTEEAGFNGGNQVEETNLVRITDYKEKIEGSDEFHQYASLRNRFNFSVVAGAGVKIRLGRDFLFLDARYTRMFFNVADPENRFSRPDLIYRFNYVGNDFRFDNATVNIGFMKSFYVPKKKRSFDEKVLEFKLSNLLKARRRAVAKVSDKVLRNELNASIKSLEREQRSLINDVNSGRRTVESGIEKAHDILKGQN